MKKLLFILTLLNCVMLFAQSEKHDFFVKIKSGNPQILERLYTIKFGDNFHYGVSTKVFTVEATKSEKIEFIDSLKKAGHQVEATDDPDEFYIVVFDNSDKTIVYSVNTSAFKESPQKIIILQKIIGNTVSGGTNDVVQRKESEIPTLRLALEDSGFECIIAGNQITIKEKTYCFDFSFPAELQATVIKTASEMGISLKPVNATQIQCSLTLSRLQAFQTCLMASGNVHKIIQGKNGAFTLLPIPAQNYTLRIYLNNKFEYDELCKVIKSNTVFTVNDKELKETRLGVTTAIFTVSTKNASETDLKEYVWKAVRDSAVKKRIKQRDIRLEKK